MLITKSIKNFLINKESSILEALQKIEKNNHRLVFVVDYRGVLEGVVTDGDFRRWLTSQEHFDLSVMVSEVMNTDYIRCSVNDDPTDLAPRFTDGVDIIPLVDSNGRLSSIAFKKDNGFQIGKFIVSNDSRCFVIAEIGNNHNGDFELAKKLVDLAVDAGADCVKFQMRNVDKLYKNSGKVDDKSADLGAQYTLDLLSRFQLSNEDLIRVFDYCKSKNTIPLCTPWDIESLRVLEDYGMEAYKVASADLTNTELLTALVATGKPLICSTGMSTEVEIKQAAGFLNKHSAQYVMLHCNSTYPTPYRDVNLLYLNRLKEISGTPVGYSGHERGIMIPVSAVVMGAKIVEKHFTIDKKMEGNDHKVSLEPEEFKEMVRQIRIIEESMGSDKERSITQGESMNREILAKSLVINQNLRSGELITRDMIDIKSPGQGLQPYHMDQLVGKIAQRDFKAGDYFFESDLSELAIKSRDYRFHRPYGIPVRYHDYNEIVSGTNVDFVEFHLSYRDLEINLSEIFLECQKIGFAVHCPELFEGDHLLDLCSTDIDYRKRSIDELQRVVNITRELKKYFPKTETPVIVINAGGFNGAGFINKNKRPPMYTQVANALDQIESDGVELLIQTMPPFPWHFGGQSHHNLFVDPDEIQEFCSKTGYRICLDVSHSQMACNYYKWSLEEFVLKVAHHTAYLHIVDALGIDGEGVQIGKGDVDFTRLSQLLNERVPEAPFIPEIWQGHKQNGAGFWKALEFLEEALA